MMAPNLSIAPPFVLHMYKQGQPVFDMEMITASFPIVRKVIIEILPYLLCCIVLSIKLHRKNEYDDKFLEIDCRPVVVVGTMFFHHL